MKITKRQLRRIIKEEIKLAGGMGHVPVPDPDLYDLGKDDGKAEEELHPVLRDNASYMAGYEAGRREVYGGRR